MRAWGVLLTLILGGCISAPPTSNGTVLTSEFRDGEHVLDLAPIAAGADAIWARVWPEDANQNISLEGFVGIGSGYAGAQSSCGLFRLGNQSVTFVFDGTHPFLTDSRTGTTTVPAIAGDNFGFSLNESTTSNGSSRILVFAGKRDGMEAQPPEYREMLLRSTSPFRLEIVGTADVSCLFGLNGFQSGTYSESVVAHTGRDLSLEWGHPGQPALLGLHYRTDQSYELEVDVNHTKAFWDARAGSGSSAPQNRFFLARDGPLGIRVARFDGSNSAYLSAFEVPVPESFLGDIGDTDQFRPLN